MFYVPLNSQDHNGMGSIALPFVGVKTPTEVIAYDWMLILSHKTTYEFKAKQMKEIGHCEKSI